MLHSCALRCSTVRTLLRSTSTLSPRNISSSSVHFQRIRRFGTPSSTYERVSSKKSDSRSARARASAEVEERSEKEAEKATAYKCLINWSTQYNNIVILEGPEDSTAHYAGCRVLLLDNSGNVHSVYRRNTAWTDSYWDEFATLPAIIPPGPVAILGLGGGTAARLLLELWPSLGLEGYEIDQVLVDNAREYLGLAELEVSTSKGGYLNVHVEDAFAPSVTVDGGFSGIIVDLFAGGEVLPQLRQPETWLDLKSRLRPGGRIMVNCGGGCVEKSDSKSKVDDGTWTWEDGASSKDATVAAMALAFPNQLSWRKMDCQDSDNVLALTGDTPDLNSWAAAVPDRLKEGVLTWKPHK